MKAEIIDGNLLITPKSKTEEYALQKWFDENTISKCTLEMNWGNLGYNQYRSLVNKVERWIYKNFPKKKRPEYNFHSIDQNAMDRAFGTRTK